MWFFKKKKQTEQDILIERIKAEQLDMQGLFSNINKRGEVEALFKELSKLSHPDKFEKDPEKKEIAQKLENELEYPGQIKVNVIREVRSVEYAK